MLREEVLPVVDSNPDDAIVVFLRIASAHVAHGDVEAAIATLRDELLPLITLRGTANDLGVVLFHIAWHLAAGGHRENAIEVFRDEALPLFEQTGDTPMIAAVHRQLTALETATD